MEGIKFIKKEKKKLEIWSGNQPENVICAGLSITYTRYKL